MDWIKEINEQIDAETASSKHCSQIILGVLPYNALKEHLKTETLIDYRGLEVKYDYSVIEDFICVIPF